MSRRFQLSKIKPANLPYIAIEVESIMAEAPGAPKPAPRKPRRHTKLELADAEIKRCAWCGSQTWASNHCPTCKTNGYPVITDFERTA